MSPEERESNDALESLIARYLEAEKSGRRLDRDGMIEEHPDLADSLRNFFANHDRMKAAANLDEPTLPPTGNDLGDPTLPPNKGSQNATIPPRSVGDDLTLLPTEGPSNPAWPSEGDHVRYFGDYELIEEIARGGMGVVFKSRQVNLNRIVALKMILAGQFAGQEDVQRFYTEAEAAANLDHPGIVPIFEIGEHQGQHYFSMGYVEGESLAQRVANGPLPPREAAELVSKICNAMAYAHERGVIHRDLKPANILIDRSGQPKVTDFGLAKKTEADSNLTGTGQILGTPAYMPPEQASGKSAEIGPLADVYSLGAILYCLLTGRPPFQAATPMDTLLQVIDKDPAPPRILNPAISRNLETIVLKCLAKDPAHRYESTSHLSSDLTAYLEDRAISARRPGIPEKVSRFCRNHRRSIAVAVSSASAVSIVALSIYYLVQSYHASQIGRLSLKSRAKLRAEIIDKHTSKTLVDVPVPTTSPIELKAGKYSLRVSSPALLSDTWPIEIGPGSQQTRELPHTQNILWESEMPGRIPSTYSIFDLGAGGRSVLVSEIKSTGSNAKSNLRMISGSTGEPIWSFQPSDQILDRYYGLALPCRDLNDDRTYDLVIASRTRPVLTAIDGKTGKSLWLFDGTSLTRQADPGLGLDEFVLGSPAYCDFDLDGQVDVAACILSQPKGTRTSSRVRKSEWWRVRDSSVRICVVTGLTGKLLWNDQIPFEFMQSGRLQIQHSDAACVPIVKQAQDHCVMNLVLSGYLHSFTVTETRKPVALGFDAISPPDSDEQGESQSGDALLFGVEVPEEMKLEMSPTEFTLKLISLDTGETKWRASLQYPTLTKDRLIRGESIGDRFGRQERYHWLTDLDSDGDREIAVAQMIEYPESGVFKVCIDLRRRDSFQQIWSIARDTIDPETQEMMVRLIAGPDVNKDGHQELFVADLVRTDNPVASLAVSCLSGKDGSVLWDQRYPITAGETIEIASLRWHRIAEQSPNLVVSTRGAGSPSDTLFLSSSSGSVEHVLPDVYAPTAIDITGDGIDDLLFEHSGSLKSIRGSPVAKWKQLGTWTPFGDLNQDGSTDFIGTEEGNLIARSGVGGEIIWQNAEGDFEVDGLLPPGSIDGVDVNDDQVPDVIALESIDADSSRPSENLCSVTALSGRDGSRLWTTEGIRAILDPKLMGPVIQWVDRDDRHEKELIIACNESRRIEKKHYTKTERSGAVARLNAHTGSVRWKSFTPDFFFATSLKKLPLFQDPRDIDGDGVADLVLWLATDRSKPTRRLTAINGVTGSVLWSAPEAELGSSLNHIPVFEDLDQDGRADVLAPHHRGQLVALNGSDGRLMWEWRNDTFFMGPKLARLANHQLAICVAVPSGIVALDRNGRELWRFDAKVLATMDENWQVNDLDGDGVDELVVPHGKSFVALNASDGSVIWTCEVPGMPDSKAKLATLVTQGSDGPANTVVWTRKSVFAIDGSGKPLWRSEATFDTSDSSMRWRNRSSLLFSWTRNNPLPGVAIASYARDADVGRTSTIMSQSVPVNVQWEWIGAAGKDAVEMSTAKESVSVGKITIESQR